ncbi:MAG: quinone-dependent dihydroorotate dehydrogenase [Pyrinomonadaceae bacterium]|nr:quinone-dependent dihydroorotate dehydrogenase [Pyrinomonadaceae bacterium]
MFYHRILRPLLFHIRPEKAHDLALHTLALTLNSSAAQSAVAKRFHRQPFGELRRFGLSFANPVGIAAGFDKNGVATQALAALGFGFIEVGTVTHLPQPGNPTPRLFRLPADKALINRQGFNNNGAHKLAERLRRERPACVLGVNIGKSRKIEIEDAIPDYLASFEAVRNTADYITVNVSSPNTPNLRELQQAHHLEALLTALQNRNRELAAQHNSHALPLLVKISPDLDIRGLEDVVAVALNTNVAGIIATNTTTSRSDLHTSQKEIDRFGAGGLSGRPLREKATGVIANLRRLAGESLVIVGVGGIFNAQDAWEKISAGASLVQLYTGFVYEGISVARDINDGLLEIMRREGIQSFDEAIGCRVKQFETIS